jgi:hypothetical protein
MALQKGRLLRKISGKHPTATHSGVGTVLADISTCKRENEHLLGPWAISHQSLLTSYEVGVEEKDGLEGICDGETDVTHTYTLAAIKQSLQSCQ